MEADKFLGNGGESAEEQDIFDLVPDGPAKFEGKLLLLSRRFKKIHKAPDSSPEASVQSSLFMPGSSPNSSLILICYLISKDPVPNFVSSGRA